MTIKKFCDNLRNENDSQLILSLTENAEKYIKECAKRSEVLNYGGRGIVSCVEKLMSVPVGKFLFDHSEVGLKAIMDYIDDVLELKVE